MRKPLAALGLALVTGLGVLPAADVLAAPSQSSPIRVQKDFSAQAQIAASSSSSSRPTNRVSGAQIINTALRYIGFPYTATGNSPSTGFSCIGFVSFVYRSNGIPLPGDLGNALAYAPSVPFSDLQPGDILYFQNTVWNGLSHAAIYLGGGRFIHSEYYGVGVRISTFNNDRKDGNYWIGKYLGANRPWAGAAGAPVVASQPGPGISVTSPTVQVSVGTQSGPPAVVKVSSLNVRTSPSKGASVQSVIPLGTSLTIIGRRPGWFKVQLPDGTVGWVIRAGVSKGAATVATPPVPPTTVDANPNIGTPTAPARQGFPSATRRHPSTRVRVDGLRVHSSPSLGASVVTTVGRGENVQVLTRRNGWTKVRTSNGSVGWVKSSYTSGVRRPAPGSTPQPPVYNTYAPVKQQTTRRTQTGMGSSVVTSGVRIHAGPGINARVVGTVGAGTRVRVLGHSRGWTLIRLPNGTTGYVLGSFVH